MRPPIRRARERGQVLVLFELSLIAILAFGALLFTGAQTLVMRRQLQNASDAAALAAANPMLNVGGCSTVEGGAPRSELVTTAQNAVTTNIPGYDVTNVSVICPAGYDNYAVTVSLSGSVPGYFGANELTAATSSTAVNGQVGDRNYNVALLDPSNPNWKSSRNGCPSYLVNGGITVTYEGSVIVDSTCTLAESNNGAVKALNASFHQYMTLGSVMRIGGEYAANTAGKITPDPNQNWSPTLKDPLWAVVEPCSSSNTSNCLGSASTLPARSMATNGSGQCKAPNNNPCILLPGTYSGGIVAASGSGPSTLLLRPGVYYIKGGGIKLKSGSGRIFAIPSSTVLPDAAARTAYATSLTDAVVATRWQTDCPPPPATSSCGVMVYNAPSGSNWQTGGGNADTVDNGSQGIFMLRPYNPAHDSLGNGSLFDSYKNLVIWQARSPVPGPNSPQPVVSMVGGACVTMSGTVYASGALLEFGGSTCGTGGGADPQMTLQFVAWDLTLSGNNDFYFAYRAGAFANPTSYGLIK